MKMQRGFSFFGMVLVVAMLSVIVTLAINIAPAYYDYAQITATVSDVLKDPRTRTQGNSELLKRIKNQLSINNIRMADLGEDAFDLSREDGTLKVKLSYDVVRPLYTNEYSSVSITTHFDWSNEATVD